MPVETSIVIRTLNEAKHLELLLQGIHDQNYRDWEIVMVDSGSTDGTLEIAERYDAKIHHIPQEEFTFGRSLNLGCQKAQGKYLVFASGHVWPITNNWLGNLIKPFQDPAIAMVYGRQRGTSASSLPELRDLHTQYSAVSHISIDEPKGNNGNAAIRRELWVNEPFDESLPGLEDVDWANKMERTSYRVYYAADAPVYHVHEETLKQIHRRYLREAIAYKRTFPNFWISISDAFRGFGLSVARDLLYVFRQSKRRQIFEIPGFRAAQYLGFYQGVRHNRRLTRETVQALEIPETYHRVEIDAPGVHKLKEAQVPVPKPDEVLIQVAYAGASIRDIAMADGTTKDGLDGPLTYPMVPGVEYSGIVVKEGGKTGSIRRGHKVAGRRFFRCGVCPNCVAENPMNCLQLATSAVHPLSGGYGNYCVVPSRFIHKMPTDISLKQGALLAPLASCLEGLDRMAPKPGRRACVLGAGMIGNLCVQILSARGVRITVVGRESKWLHFLSKYEVDTLTELGSLEKYDYLVATGSEDMLSGSVNSAESNTKILVIGSPLSINGRTLASLELEQGEKIFNDGAVKPESWDEASRLVLSGQISLDNHTAVVESLEDYRLAWEAVANGERFNSLLCVSRDLELL